MSVQRVGWWAFVSGLLAILSAYLLLLVGVAGHPASLLMIYGVGATVVGPLLLVESRGRLTRPVLVTVLTVSVVVLGGFTWALLLPPDAAADGKPFGLPLRAAIVLLGVGVLPAFVLPWAYAKAMRNVPLDPQSMADFVAACRAAREESRS